MNKLQQLINLYQSMGYDGEWRYDPECERIDFITPAGYVCSPCLDDEENAPIICKIFNILNELEEP